MNIKKKDSVKIAGICLFLLAAVGGIYLLRIDTQKRVTSDMESSSVEITSTKDTQPLPINPQSVKNGRVVTVLILMYHHVGDLPQDPDATRRDLTVSLKNFSDQVKWIAANGYTSISLNDIYLYSQGKFSMPKKPVVFTFDDGYEDVLQNAVPILKQYGFTGSFGIITNNPGTTQGDNVYAPWSNIAQAYQAGNEIVSHTEDHFDGSSPKFSSDFIYSDLSGSIAAIKQHLGFTTHILIYPYGHYSNIYLAQAKKAGLTMGVTVHEGDMINLDDLMEVPRVRVHGAEDLQRFEDVILDKLSKATSPRTSVTSTPATTSQFRLAK